MLETALHDLRHTLRQLRQSPVYAATVILTLALGIGANTAIFTFVQGILLRSLPVAAPAQLYRIGDTDDCCVNGGFVGTNGDFDIFSYDLYQHFKAAAPEFESLAAVQAGQGLWTVRRGAATPRPMHGEYVSGNFFSTLGLVPFAGRFFSNADDQLSAAPVAVVSYAAWQDEFGGDRSVLGATISIHSQPVTVIGIAPRGFFGDRVTDTPASLWLPISTQPRINGQPLETSLLGLPDSHWLYPIGRVRRGTSIPALQAKLSATLRNWLYSRPTYTKNGGAAVIPKQHVVLVPGGGGIQSLQQETGSALEMLMLLALAVLAIACANIANVVLARSMGRRSEIAVRMALGEARSRLVRRVLTECVLLGCVGGVAGLAIAYAGARSILQAAFPNSAHSAIVATPSAAVLAFAFGISVLTGILFGLAPAWLASRSNPADALRGANRSTRDRSSLGQRALVVVQVALSLVLIGGALLAARSLNNVEHQDFAIATANRWVLHFDPSGAGYTSERLPALYRQMEDRFSALPGVAHVALGMYSPLEGDNWGECVIPMGHGAPGPNDRCGASWVRVSPGYLDAIGVPILRGRNFSAADTNATQQVALVNETFAKRFFPNQDAVGQHFGIDYPKYSGAFAIAGVFRDFKLNNPRNPARPVYLRPLQQPYAGFTEPGMRSLVAGSMIMQALLVEYHVPPAAPDQQLRRTLASVDSGLPVLDLRSFQSQVDNNFNQDRLVSELTSLFGLLALLLASVGLYGVTSYLVARRTSEIGVRMALGASRPRVVAMVLRGVMIQVAAGLALGIPAAYFAGRAMASVLYKTDSYGPAAWATAAIALAICACVAGLIPARRAASVDPVRTLRAE